MRTASLFAWFGIVGLGVGCASGGDEAASVAFEGGTMGTTYLVRVVPDVGVVVDEAALAEEIQQVLDGIESEMSHYRSDSEVSRFNQARHTEPIAVSAQTFDVVAGAIAIGRASGGALDITVGPLVNAWGFGPEEPAVLPPDGARVQELLEATGLDRLELDARIPTIRKALPEVEVDLSAVAKGYAVDRVAETVARRGHHRFMVEVGGEVVARGTNPGGRPWRIAIERPTAEGGIKEVVPLPRGAMATSGDYRNVREVEGRLLSHTIDPRTGHPVTHRLTSVTVVADSCLEADGLATALEVLGPEAGYALAEELELAALFLIRGEDGSISARATAGFESLRDGSPSATGLE